MNTLITVYQDNDLHINNMLRGVSQGSVLPDEIIIVSSNSAPDISCDYDLNIRLEYQDQQDLSSYTLNRARNVGVRFASYENIHFLNVDCIPERNYFEKMNFFLQTCNGFIMGSPRQLLAEPKNEFHVDELHRLSKHHYKRPRVSGIKLTKETEVFWSLCFSAKKSNFSRLPGFDENYIGVGIEDSDFSLSCVRKEISLYLSEAIAYHSKERVTELSADKIETIVSNCNHFYSKWKFWPLQFQLKQFSQQGLIQWEKDQHELIKINKENDFIHSDQSTDKVVLHA